MTPAMTGIVPDSSSLDLTPLTNCVLTCSMWILHVHFMPTTLSKSAVKGTTAALVYETSEDIYP